MSKLKLALAVFFVFLVLVVSAAEHGVENANMSNESYAINSVSTETSTSEQVDSASLESNDNVTSTVISKDSQPSESAEISANIEEHIEEQSQTTEEKTGKAVTASFGVYLEIVG